MVAATLLAKIAFWIIGIAVLLIGLSVLVPGGLLDRTSDAIIPDDLIPEEFTDTGLTLPAFSPEHQAEISKLKQTIVSMLGSDTQSCFADYGGFTDLENVAINLNYDTQKDTTYFEVMGGPGGKQVRTDLGFEIPKMSPCVIAGTSSVTNAFESSYLNSNSPKTITSGHFTTVTTLKIAHSTSPLAGNIIRAAELGGDIVNDESDNFEDAGILYKPQPGMICFFPTVYGDTKCDGGDKDGLDNDCLIRELQPGSINKPINLYHQLQAGTIPKC
jgi:hypothetical protein